MTIKRSKRQDAACQRQFADGRQCRMLRLKDHPSLCPFHAREEQQRLETEKLAAELASLSGKLNTATDINHILGKVFTALAHNRISARNATTLAYIGQLLLQSLPNVRNEINIAAGDYQGFSKMIRRTFTIVPPK